MPRSRHKPRPYLLSDAKPRPYLLADAIETFRHTKRRLSYHTQRNANREAVLVAEALSDRSSNGIHASTGLSLDLTSIRSTCSGSQGKCLCYQCLVSKIVDYTHSKGFAESSASRVLECFNSILNLAVSQAHVQSIDTSGNARRIKPCREVVSFSEDQLSTFFEKADEPVSRCGFYIAARAGLRRLEILHLRWEDVEEFDRGFLLRVRAKPCVGHTSCRRTRAPGNSGIGYGWWKTKTRENRKAACGKGLAHHLGIIQKIGRGSPWLFPGLSTRNPLTDAAFSKKLRLELKKAGLYKPNRKYGYHTGRRTFITRLIKKGVPTAKVAKMAGCTIANIENYLSYDPTEEFELFDS